MAVVSRITQGAYSSVQECTQAQQQCGGDVSLCCHVESILIQTDRMLQYEL